MIKLTQGEQLTITSVLNRNRRLVDITTWDIKAAIRRSEEGEVLANATVNKLGLGTFTVRIDASGIQPSQYVLAIRIAEPGGFIRTFNEPLLVRKDLNW